MDVQLDVPEGVYVRLSDNFERLSWYDRERVQFQQCVEGRRGGLDMETVEYLNSDEYQEELLKREEERQEELEAAAEEEAIEESDSEDLKTETD